MALRDSDSWNVSIQLFKLNKMENENKKQQKHISFLYFYFFSSNVYCFFFIPVVVICPSFSFCLPFLSISILKYYELYQPKLTDVKAKNYILHLPAASRRVDSEQFTLELVEHCGKSNTLCMLR